MVSKKTYIVDIENISSDCSKKTLQIDIANTDARSGLHKSTINVDEGAQPNAHRAAIAEKDILDLAWKYFQQHAQQRINFMNFFVILSSALTIAMVTILKDAKGHRAVVLIGIVQCFLSFIFWKIDQRNQFLTKHGENVIKNIERKIFIECDEYSSCLRLFCNEVNYSEEKMREGNFFYKQLSHGKCYKYMLSFYAFLGLAGIFLSLK